MSYIDFDDARQAHSQIYPPSPVPIYYPPNTLAVAAAFEGMHHWEHENRQGSVERIPRDDARSSLATVVGRDTERLLEKTSSGINMDVQSMKANATQHAMHMYDQQYGGAEWYDPGQVAAHETMRAEWREDGWGLRGL